MRKQQRGDVIGVVLIATVLVMSLGALGYKFWSSAERSGRLACENELRVAEQMLDAAWEDAKAKAENHIIDMVAAYEAGAEENKKKQVIYVTKGASDVAKYPVFNNPACVLPDDSLHNLNGARSGLQAAVDPPAPVAAVPKAKPVIRWPTGDGVSADDKGRGNLQ